MTRLLRRAVLAAAVVALMLGGSQQASAAIVIYQGKDAGVGPGGARPNSNAAAAAFDAAAAALGTVNLITFETAPLGNFASLSVAPGVTANLSGTAGDADAGITNVTGDATLGYNTTAGGSRYLRFVPVFDIGTANIRFDFTTPVQAFGTYITGLGTANGNLQIVFFDGSSQNLPVIGSAGGGVQFFGFTDAGTSIASINLRLTGVVGSRDISSYDDVRYVSAGGAQAVPEPTSLVLGLFGVAGTYLYARRRRQQAAA